MMLLTYSTASDIGLCRKNNEDAFVACPLNDARYIVLAAIDGMGGTEGGEVAAAITRDTIVSHLNDFTDGSPLARVKAALTKANNNVAARAAAEPRLADMGCVATVGLVDLDDHTLSVAHVGDSRLYRLADGELTKLTNDHSMVGYQEEQGILTEDQAMHHPYRSIIERYVGQKPHNADDPNFIHAAIFPLIDGETFLFCTDGLSDMVSSADIQACLQADADIETQCRLLIDKANAAGGKDNVTVVIAHVTDNGCDDTKSEPTISVAENHDATSTSEKSSFWPWLITTIVACGVCMAIGYMLGYTTITTK